MAPMTTAEWVLYQWGLSGDEYRRSFDVQCAVDSARLRAQWARQYVKPLWRDTVRAWLR